MSTCAKCGIQISVGDWPWCPHDSVRESHALRFDAIVVWQSNTDSDQYSFPGRASEPVPEGYHRVEITDLRQADQFVSKMNGIERRRMQEARDKRRALDDAGIRERRQNEDARGTGNARAEALRRRVREWTDKVREQRRRQHSRIDPQFHINVLSFDSGNRSSYSGPETGWRERKS